MGCFQTLRAAAPCPRRLWTRLVQVLPCLRIVDAATKTRHCALMLLVAPVLAGNAPEEAQARTLARYTFLWADSLLEWARRWRNELSRSDDRTISKHGHQMKPEIARFANLLGRVGGVRDYLVAKRQPLALLRADDIEATALMWLAVNPTVVNDLWLAAIRMYDGLATVTESAGSIVEVTQLPFETRARVRAALPVREQYWYLATDTGADYRANTLPAAQGGDLGRLIAQVNDVVLHVDTLLRIAPVLSLRLVRALGALGRTGCPPRSHGGQAPEPARDQPPDAA